MGLLTLNDGLQRMRASIFVSGTFALGSRVPQLQFPLGSWHDKPNTCNYGNNVTWMHHKAAHFWTRQCMSFFQHFIVHSLPHQKAHYSALCDDYDASCHWSWHRVRSDSTRVGALMQTFNLPVKKNAFECANVSVFEKESFVLSKVPQNK